MDEFSRSRFIVDAISWKAAAVVAARSFARHYETDTGKPQEGGGDEGGPCLHNMAEFSEDDIQRAKIRQLVERELWAKEKRSGRRSLLSN